MGKRWAPSSGGVCAGRGHGSGEIWRGCFPPPWQEVAHNLPPVQFSPASVSLVKPPSLMAVSWSPQPMPSAGLPKDNFALTNVVIPQHALWSQVPPHYQRRVLGLGTVPCSSHSPQTNTYFGHMLWTLTSRRRFSKTC